MLTKAKQNEGHVHEPSVIPPGQRERNKRDKLLRIKNAAQELFVSKGYDDTTTREIAVRAGVGMGTVFTYAANKRDLLFLIANDDLEATIRKAGSEISSDAPLMTNLLAIFRNHYEYFARQPELSRLMLREMVFYDSGEQANKFRSTREKVISLIGESVRFAKQNKTIRTSQDHRAIGWILFCIYQIEIRNWLSEGNLKLKTGLDRLEHFLQASLEGVAPKKGSLALKRKRISTQEKSRRKP